MSIAFKKFLLDILFPAYCLSCQKEGSYLCLECVEKIECFSSARCFVCGKRLPDRKQCEVCGPETAVKRIYSALSYKDEFSVKLIKTFKYRFVFDLAKPLSTLLIRSLEKSGFENIVYSNITIFIPIPLHKKRLRWRGFNQAELIARELSLRFSIPLECFALNRVKYKKPQSELKGEERKKNAEGIFSVKESERHKIHGKNIILVDDIKTSGATLEECAKILKQNGARNVWAVTLAT